jgi:cytochrome c556
MGDQRSVLATPSCNVVPSGETRSKLAAIARGGLWPSKIKADTAIIDEIAAREDCGFQCHFQAEDSGRSAPRNWQAMPRSRISSRHWHKNRKSPEPMTPDDFRKIALSMPKVGEVCHRGRSQFRLEAGYFDPRRRRE